MITTTVRQILATKGDHIWEVAPETPVLDALRLMAEQNVGAVLVRRDAELAGIFSERDYARKVILRGRSSKTTPVGDVMTSRVVYVRPEQTTEECMALMTDKHIRHLPVLADGKLLGMISIGDVVKAIVADQRFIIQQLENYIAGGR
jgi:CBS domain-containing protein